MARSVTDPMQFQSSVLNPKNKDRTYRHVTDSEFASALATKQRVVGVTTPHPSTKGPGVPVKTTKK